MVTAGHYQAFYFSGDADDLWPLHLVHDDNQKAIAGTEATRQAILTNSYLLAYSRGKGTEHCAGLGLVVSTPVSFALRYSLF